MSVGIPLVCLKWFNESLDHDTSGCVLIIRTAPSASLIINPVHKEFSLAHSFRNLLQRNTSSPASPSATRSSAWLAAQIPRHECRFRTTLSPGNKSSREGNSGQNMCSSAGLLLEWCFLPLSYQIHVSTAGCVELIFKCKAQADMIQLSRL